MSDHALAKETARRRERWAKHSFRRKAKGRALSAQGQTPAKLVGAALKAARRRKKVERQRRGR